MHGHRARRLQSGRDEAAWRRQARRRRLDHHPAGGQELPAHERPHRSNARSRRRSSPSASSAPTAKDKILELYLNEIYLGIGAYGVAAAGLAYFNKELKDLTVEEVAYLAALPEGPEQLSPLPPEGKSDRPAELDHRPDGRERLHHGRGSRCSEAKPLTVNFRTGGAHIFAAEYFAEEVRRSLLAEYGENKLYGGGLSVRTTLDPQAATDGPQGR